MSRNTDELRRQIEEYYLPRQLVDAILDLGGIPSSARETDVGVGFIDIVDYTYLSKFLSPKENQEVLNGLYTAFNSVLKRHGGYLNKIEGDSVMFHYGGFTDERTRTGDEAQALRMIAKELFFTCVEMQRVAVLFNQANQRFLSENSSEKDRQALQRAFEIISRLREDEALMSSMNAMFQIRIRVGASVGVVTIGNFGPEGARQWDVIGIPVIDAKRMETTAPVGGLRIAKEYFDILNQIGVVDEYYKRFLREAQILGSRYQQITKEELFQYKPVTIENKKNARYETYSIQVNPGLPEQIASQAESLLEQGASGADIILQLLQAYRGNRFIIDAMEELFVRKGIRIRRRDMFEPMYPRRYHELFRECNGDMEQLEERIRQEYSLFDLFQKLGKYQDIIKTAPEFLETPIQFGNFEQYMHEERERIQRRFEEQKQAIVQRSYFYNVVYPIVFTSIRASILEFQSESEELELLSS
ncbi:MAG: adenylate/guanylate cyclase domain-containing protein [Alkalispirochaetaceae bacterium]